MIVCGVFSGYTGTYRFWGQWVHNPLPNGFCPQDYRCFLMVICGSMVVWGKGGHGFRVKGLVLACNLLTS